MSFCAHGPLSSHNCVSQNILRLTAERLRSIIQSWIVCFLGTAWMSTEAMYDSAQEGRLLYPLGLIDIHYPGIKPIKSLKICDLIQSVRGPFKNF